MLAAESRNPSLHILIESPTAFLVGLTEAIDSNYFSFVGISLLASTTPLAEAGTATYFPLFESSGRKGLLMSTIPASTIQSRRGRQLQFISEFTTDIERVKGTDNVVANLLSRPTELNALFKEF